MREQQIRKKRSAKPYRFDNGRAAALSLRRVQPEDEQFLLELYGDHRREELDQASWKEEERRTFLCQQFQAQLQHYRTHYPQGEHHLILAGSTAIGRIYVDWGGSEIRLLDISLLSKYRNRGIGTVLMRGLLAEADRKQKPIRLYVYTMNRALRFYERLGFKCIEDTGVHNFMERCADSGWLPGATDENDLLDNVRIPDE